MLRSALPLILATLSGVLILTPRTDAATPTAVIFCRHAGAIEKLAASTTRRSRSSFVVNSENEVKRRTVTTGIKVGELVVITEGLTAGDTVITDDLQRARPGAKVTPERIELKPLL